MANNEINMNPDIMKAILHEVVDINTKITGYETRIKEMENDLRNIKIQNELLHDNNKGLFKRIFGG